MASTTTKKTCARCKKGAGTAMCHGCEQSFCIKHFNEHRQELSQQMDNLGQEHDVLQRDLTHEQDTHPLLTCIDEWEKESITKIQVAADVARADLRQLLDRTKNHLKKSTNKITEELQSSRESDDYTEIDINKWIERLKEIRETFNGSSIVDIDYDKNSQSTIHMIKIKDEELTSSSTYGLKVYATNDGIVERVVPSSHERFDQFSEGITLMNDGLMATHSSIRLNDLSISGIERYSSGTHHIRFKIENKKDGYAFFFGIVTSSQELTKFIWHSPSAHGWWDLDCSVVAGKQQERNSAKLIQIGDEITLILECDKRLIQMKHDRTNTVIHMSINLQLCALPWKIVVGIPHKDACVRILH